MVDHIVVGLFPTKGEAQNAGRRIVTEGANQDDVLVRTLRGPAPVPDAVDPELATVSLDPFFWFLGDLKEDYAGQIINGETAVCVTVRSPREEEDVVTMLLMYEPKRVDVVVPADLWIAG